ncbi:hypothetical protein [Chryseobacterium caseinilyticum]|uniref:Uncharacterized protein n=1 Tax=Chryseobacterium caseinilyticum TaxID=2771428 RepID=A0ABR8Z979_9FLAO|nr:hypothetical protein [Chryseobacterium caseinilyticum]MBD8081829.1 hypothetical protein [Chryseobacterium caseinilyticum]
MKKLLLLLIILTFNFSVQDECSFSGINVWPTQQNIAPNSIFVIEGYADSQELIIQLNKKNKIYLKGNSERVPIKVLRILKGQYGLTQAILQPERELQTGKTYELQIDGLGEFEKQDYTVAKWTVSSKKDLDKPVWDCLPSYKNRTFRALGCGPERFINFCGILKDNSPTLIYAKVFNRTNKTQSDYFLTVEGQNISIGHDMCSGAFAFHEDTEYEVQFGLMDASGNENMELTEPVKFTGPTEKDESDSEPVCNCTTKSAVSAKADSKSNLLIYSILGGVIAAIGIIIYLKQKRAVY